MRKPRSDSKLKTLPAERQAQIVEWLETPKSETSPGGIALALEQLAADGIKTSPAALSDFYSWWQLQRDFEEADSHAEEIKDLLKGADLKMTTEQIEAAGRLIFTKDALKRRDSKGFQDIQYLKVTQDSARLKGELEKAKLKLRQRVEERADRKLALEIEKLVSLSVEKLYEAARDGKAREIVERAIPKAEQIAALRAEYFADVDALQKSGRIKLPE